MSDLAQKRLAIAGVVAAAALFVGANVQLFSAAFRSQPECVAVEGAAMPAKSVC